MTNYSPLHDAQQDDPISHCALCQGEIYAEDLLFEWEGIHICEECLKNKFDALTTVEKADLLGARQIKAGD